MERLAERLERDTKVDRIILGLSLLCGVLGIMGMVLP
jgi:hypothetical protein